MLYRVIEERVVPASRDLGIGQIVWSPVAQGVLTGKYKPGQPAPEGSRATSDEGKGFVDRWMSDDVLNAVQQLEPIAADHGLTMAQLALAWVLQNDNVSSAIMGASRPEQVYANVKASGVKLEADVMQAIDKVIGHLAVRDPELTVAPNPRP